MAGLYKWTTLQHVIALTRAPKLRNKRISVSPGEPAKKPAIVHKFRENLAQLSCDGFAKEDMHPTIKSVVEAFINS